MLRHARVDPKLSSYAVLEGQFNFNKTPLAPVGTKALVFFDQKHRKTFNTHAVDVFYVGPAMKHYRNYRFLFPTLEDTEHQIRPSFFQRIVKCHQSNQETQYD